MSDTDYKKFRGKCKEMAEALVKADPTLRLVRGHYHCPMWGRQAHWWTVKPDGVIVDPSVRQFPTKGMAAEYVEWSGVEPCINCGDAVVEADLIRYSGCCSWSCFGSLVGIHYDG